MITENIEISIGELWDKYSILLIKNERIKNDNKLEYINKEIEILSKNMNKFVNYLTSPLFIKLKNINEQLWEIEDKIRIKEQNKEFDNEFIQLARSVYVTNDKRCDCKNEINNIFGSTIKEVKEYVDYQE